MGWGVVPARSADQANPKQNLIMGAPTLNGGGRPT
jgi:hypothetical protein